MKMNVMVRIILNQIIIDHEFLMLVVFQIQLRCLLLHIK